MPNLFSFLLASKKPEPAALSFSAPVCLQATQAGEEPVKRPTFSINAYSGGEIFVAAFSYPVVVDLEGVTSHRPKIPILLDHDQSRIIGQASDVTINASGIKLSGTITGDDGDAQKVIAHAKNGFEWQASIGVDIKKREFVDSGREVTVNGRTFSGPIIVARSANLFETSFVAVGADNTATATLAASISTEPESATGQGVVMEFNEWLKAKGFSPEGLSDTQRTTLHAAFSASQIGDTASSSATGTIDTGSGGDDGVATLRAQYATEAKRVGEINRIVAKYKVGEVTLDSGQKVSDLAAHAIENGMDCRDVELIALRAARPQATHTPQRQHAATGDVLEASIAVGAGLRSVEKDYKPETLEAAHKQFRGGLGLQELLLQAAFANGYTGSMSFKNNLDSILRAAFSTLSLPGILSNVANKFLLEGFNSVDQSWREIADIANATDFKTRTSYRMSGDFKFLKLGKDGEIQHATVSEDTYTNKVDTYARMFAITRQDIINDDLGALTTEPRKRLGVGSAKALNDVFWATFLDDATFFPTDKSLGNYIDGATSALSAAGLAEGEEAFLTLMKGDDYVGTTPRILLVPPQLAVTAQELFVSNTYTGGSSKTPAANIFAGKYKPVVSRYLTNATAWYLLADPSELAAIEVAFLNGMQSPTIETADADFNQLGIQMRGYFDFGVGLVEPLAGIKSKGAA